MPCHAGTSTPAQPLHRFPKAIARCSGAGSGTDVALQRFSHLQPSQGKTRPLARLSCNVLKVRQKAGACGLPGLCKTPWGGYHFPGQAWLPHQAGRALGCRTPAGSPAVLRAAVISGCRKRWRGMEKMKEPPSIRRRPSVQPGPFQSCALRDQGKKNCWETHFAENRQGVSGCGILLPLPATHQSPSVYFNIPLPTCLETILKKQSSPGLPHAFLITLMLSPCKGAIWCARESGVCSDG